MTDPQVVSFLRRHRSMIASVVVAAIVGGGGTAAALVLWRRPADPFTLICYSDAAVEPASKVGLFIDPDLTPVDQCMPFWSDGTLGTAGTDGLVACVADRDVTVVIPGASNGCEALGWSPAARPSPAERLDQQVAAEVPELFGACVDDLDEARQQVEALLAELGAADTWSVVVNGPTRPERPCAANVIDGVNRVVLIVPYPGPPD